MWGSFVSYFLRGSSWHSFSWSKVPLGTPLCLFSIILGQLAFASKLIISRAQNGHYSSEHLKTERGEKGNHTRSLLLGKKQFPRNTLCLPCTPTPSSLPLLQHWPDLRHMMMFCYQESGTDIESTNRKCLPQQNSWEIHPCQHTETYCFPTCGQSVFFEIFVPQTMLHQDPYLCVCACVRASVRYSPRRGASMSEHFNFDITRV